MEKLSFQRSTVSWKLFSGIRQAHMIVHTSSIAEHGCVAISNNLDLGSGITHYPSTNPVWKHSF